MNKDQKVINFGIHKGDKIVITEFAPKLFRSIRQKIVSEASLAKSFEPKENFKGIHNFQTGTGKSPSYFFFTDNNLFMLKNLKDLVTT